MRKLDNITEEQRKL